MKDKELKALFSKAYPANDTYLRMYERDSVAEKIIMILLAAFVRRFPKDTKTQMDLVTAFIGTHQLGERNSQLAIFWRGVSPFFEEGARPRNIRCISCAYRHFFRHLQESDITEETLIVLYVASSVLFRKPTFWCQFLMMHNEKTYGHQDFSFPPAHGKQFLAYFKTALLDVLGTDLSSDRETYYLLSTIVVFIYNFTERYLGYIWEPTEMCELPEYIDNISKLIHHISGGPLVDALKSDSSC